MVHNEVENIVMPYLVVVYYFLGVKVQNMKMNFNTGAVSYTHLTLPTILLV